MKAADLRKGDKVTLGPGDERTVAAAPTFTECPVDNRGTQNVRVEWVDHIVRSTMAADKELDVCRPSRWDPDSLLHRADNRLDYSWYEEQ